MKKIIRERTFGAIKPKKIYRSDIYLVELIVIEVLSLFMVILGGFLLPKTEGIALCCGGLCVGIFIFLFYKLKGKIDYIVITSEGIKNKKIFLAWKDICLTVDYDVCFTGRRGSTYFCFLNDQYYQSLEELKSARAQKMFIELTEDRIIYLIQFYHRPIKLLRKAPYQKSIFNIITDYNQMKNYTD